MRPQTSETMPDLSWSPLYRAGAICAGITVVMYLAALALYGVAVTPTDSNGQEMLEFIVDNCSVYILKQTLWVLPSAFLIVTFLALAVALFCAEQIRRPRRGHDRRAVVGRNVRLASHWGRITGPRDARRPLHQC
jgi:ABC-type Fe3+ transport system permease subunit